jgi:hypothetical protein
MVTVPVLLVAPPASAKEEGPIRVVAESGKVGWIRGASAKAWWADLYPSLPRAQSGSCTCDSPREVAKFEQRFLGRARWKVHDDGGWPTGMLLIQSGHSAAWLYYPASRTTPPYLVAPGGVGKEHLRWDEWRMVTPRMQRIVAAALRHGSISTYTGGSTAFPTGWVVGGSLGGLVLAGLVLLYVTKLTSLRGTTIVLRGSPPSR